MRQKLFFGLFILLLTSCSTTKNAMNSWIGHSSKDVILSWGPPNRIAPDGGTGEIYIYSTQCSRLNGQVYYYYRMLYLNDQKKVYYWMVKEENVPPTQVDVSIYRRY